MSVAAFTASLAQFQDKLGARLDEAVVHIAFECAENIIVGGTFSPGSPVDTGFFRASWIISLDEAPALDPTNQPPGKKQTYPNESMANAELSLLGMKAGRKMFLVNPVAYGERLEFGWSSQAPVGMVRITAAAGQHIVDKVVRGMQ